MAVVRTALIIDDHPLVARGIAAFLQSRCGFDRVHAISNTNDLWEFIEQEGPPTMVVVDFWLADGGSLPLVASLRERCPDMPILVVSADDDPGVQDKVRTGGASGFLRKQDAVDVFAQASAALLKGRAWFPDAGRTTRGPFPPKELPITAEELGLTARQGEVLEMVLKGYPNKRIALALSLSEQTVKEHVTGIFDRLGVCSRVEIIIKLRGRRFG